MFDPFEIGIAFFLICAIVFNEDIDVFERNTVIVKIASFVLLASIAFIAQDHPGIAFLCAVLFSLLMARNFNYNFVVA